MSTDTTSDVRHFDNLDDIKDDNKEMKDDDNKENPNPNPNPNPSAAYGQIPQEPDEPRIFDFRHGAMPEGSLK